MSESSGGGGGRKGIVADWSNLPEGPLGHIARKHVTLSDYIRFRSVCRSWRSAAAPSFHRRPQPPLLLLEHDPDRDDGATFLIPSTARLLKPYLPELRDKVVLASGYGWLVLLDVHAMALSLLNPISSSKIILPSTSGFKKQLNWAPFICSSPSATGDCVVLVLQCYEEENIAAFCKVGEVSWSMLDTGLNRPNSPISIAYHDEKFYVLDRWANLTVCRAAEPESPVLIGSLSRQISPSGNPGEVFLGLIDGELLYAGFEYNFFNYGSFMSFVRVRKADPSKPLELSDVRSLGRKALFFSATQLFMVDIEDFSGWREDCIYSPYALERASPVQGDAISVISLRNEENIRKEKIEVLEMVQHKLKTSYLKCNRENSFRFVM